MPNHGNVTKYFKMTPIEFNNKDFEEKTENILFDLYYLDSPFTGFLKDDNCIIEYRDGFANGKFLEYFPDGSLCFEGYYVNGECISSKEWYQNGQIKIEGDNIFTSEGLLAKKGNSWLYKTGQPKEARLENSTQYFSPNGDLAFEVNYLHSGDYKNIITYNNEIMVKYCNKIISNIYPELDQYQYNIEYYFYGWVAALLIDNFGQGTEVIELLIIHKQKSVSDGFMNFKNSYSNWNLNDYISKLGYHIILK